MTPPAASSPSRPRRASAVWLRPLVLTLLAVELLYLVAGNAFLWSELGPKTINRKPEKLRISWQKAWTLAPFWVHVRGLEIDANARTARWTLTADAARLNLWLPSLAGKHFRLLDADGSGVELEIDRLEPTGPRPHKEHPWRFTVDGGDLAPIERLRIGELELAGSGTVRGSADFLIRGPVELHLDQVSFADGRLISGGATVASALALDARGIEIGPFVIAESGPREVLATLRGDLELETRTESLAFLDSYLGQESWLSVGGAGLLRLDGGLRAGRLTAATTLALTEATLEARLIGLRAHGEGELLGRVPEGTSGAELALTLERFAVDRAGEGKTLIEGEGLRLVTTSESTALDQVSAGITLAAHLPPARVPDLAAFAGYVPEASAIVLTGGAGELGGELRFDSATRQGDGSLKLVAQGVSARAGDLDLRFDLDLELELTETRLDEGTTALDGSHLRIDHARIAGAGGDSTGWWAAVRIPQGRLWSVAAAEDGANEASATGASANEGSATEGAATQGAATQGAATEGAAVPRRLAIDARVEAEMRDSRPLVAVLVERKPKLDWFEGLLTVEDVDASGRLRMAGQALGLYELDIRGGDSVEILAEIDRYGPRRHRGVLFARYRRLSAAVALADGKRGGGNGWKLFGSRAWYERAAAEYRSARRVR